MCLRFLETIFVKFVATYFDPFHTVSAVLGRVQGEKPDLVLSELIFEPYTGCTR